MCYCGIRKRVIVKRLTSSKMYYDYALDLKKMNLIDDDGELIKGDDGGENDDVKRSIVKTVTAINELKRTWGLDFGYSARLELEMMKKELEEDDYDDDELRMVCDNAITAIDESLEARINKGKKDETSMEVECNDSLVRYYLRASIPFTLPYLNLKEPSPYNLSGVCVLCGAKETKDSTPPTKPTTPMEEDAV